LKISAHDRSIQALIWHQGALDVGGQVAHAVAPDGFRDVSLIVASEIGSDDVIPGGQGRKLMPSRVPQLRESVEEDDERTLPRLGDVHGDPVASNLSMHDV
jgi:hypothetical protein